MTLALVVLAAAASPGLDEALETERTALESERAALEARLATLEADRRRLEAEGVRTASRLAERLERVRAEASQLETEARELLDDGTSTPWSLGPILQEAQRVLEAEVPSDPEAEAALGALFDAARAALERARTLHEDAERFFGPEGRPVDGQVLHVGALTAFGRGTGPNGARVEGPLVQIDGAWTLLEPADVGAVFGERGSEVIPLAVSEAAVDEVEQAGWQERLAAGGPLALPILGLGLVVVGVAIARLLALRRLSRGDAALEAGLVEALGQGRTADAEALLAAGGRTGVARIGRVVLAHRDLPPEPRAELAQSALVDEIARAERRLSLLKLIAAASPLLGLLGTVMGMIETFDVISVYGAGDASRLSGGISKALVTTELGLFVAVPTLFVHGALASWVDRIADRLERVARDLPALLGTAGENR